ncbi:MAG: serine dehydratase subunit alpha family protein [Firmicutes bacterium]|nr:serine dehydratase subunit alpha family protein [Bacillota bacterium]
MEAKVYDAYVQILESELLKALGCTEPGAVAFTAAKATEVLGKMPERMEVNSSGNIIKNVKGVIVPNSGGLRGIAPAAILGALVAKPELELEILEDVTDEDRAKAKELMAQDGYCKSTVEEGEGNLYVEVAVWAGDDSARVIIRNNHTNITLIEKNGESLQSGAAQNEGADIAEMKKLMSVEGIIEFAKTCNLDDVKHLLDQQIECNNAIGEEGLKGGYGAEVGKTLIETYGDDMLVKVKALAAAGSDARMAGSVMPVVINSGSGNQGITVTNSVTEFAKGIGASEEQMYRGLLISNLISIHIKKHIGPLSAFCGAVSAGAGASGAFTFLCGGTDEQIGQSIINVLGDCGGMVCDGAKSSCAAKIASSIDAAIMGHKMAMAGRGFEPGEGLVMDDVEETIRSIGYMGRVGMKETDVEILHVMLGDRDLDPYK